jgi:similar to spore coat protein
MGVNAMTKHLGIHEALELHEYLAFKNVCLTKSALMSKLAVDEELKAILETDAETGVRHIQTLQEFFTDRGSEE